MSESFSLEAVTASHLLPVSSRWTEGALNGSLSIVSGALSNHVIPECSYGKSSFSSIALVPWNTQPTWRPNCYFALDGDCHEQQCRQIATASTLRAGTVADKPSQ